MSGLQFKLFVVLVILIGYFALPTDSVVRRVRKYISKSLHDPHRRSPTDDALDIAAAEEIFKDLQKSKKPEGPPQFEKTGHFPTVSNDDDDDWDDAETKKPQLKHDQTGAPAAEPTVEELMDASTQTSVFRKQKVVEKEKETSTEQLDSLELEPEENPITEKPISKPSSIQGRQQISNSEAIFTDENNNTPKTKYEKILPYDYRVNPEYAQNAPYARGLVGIPDGWNMDKPIDEEFKLGYRRRKGLIEKKL